MRDEPHRYFIYALIAMTTLSACLMSLKYGKITFDLPQPYMFHRLEFFSLALHFGGIYIAINSKFFKAQEWEQAENESIEVSRLPLAHLFIVLLSSFVVTILALVTVGSADNWS